jgi:uridine phosphorylase
LFIVGAYRGWRTGALYASDGTNTEIKPEWGEEQYKKGQADMIRVALEAMLSIAKADAE